MVPVRKVSDQFEARVLAARLGSVGIVAQLRGGGIDGPYPMGAIEVLVSEDDLEAARELLLADEVESSFDTAEADEAAPEPVPAYRVWLLVAASGLVALSALVSSLIR